MYFCLLVGLQAQPAGPDPDFQPGDSNNDGEFDQSDAIFTINYLFGNGPPPLSPFLDSGEDTGDSLGCETYDHC